MSKWRTFRRWVEAWAIGTAVIWIARKTGIPWPLALLAGGFLIGAAEAFLNRDL